MLSSTVSMHGFPWFRVINCVLYLGIFLIMQMLSPSGQDSSVAMLVLLVCGIIHLFSLWSPAE